MGGGTPSSQVGGGAVEVLATDGDPWLGGDDLDGAIARYLCERRIGFHNGGLVRSGGSNWARGAAGVGVEFAGHFDGTWFNQSDVSQINYCSASGFGSPSDLVTGEQCEHELSRNGSTGSAVLAPAHAEGSVPPWEV